MNSLVKSISKILFTVFVVLYFCVIILVTACLLCFNDYGVTEFGKTSFLILDKNLSDSHKKGDLLLVTKNEGEELIVGDYIFFYDPMQNNTVNYAQVVNVIDTDGYYSYEVGNDYIVYQDYLVGRDTVVLSKAGYVLSLLESKIGFLVLIILPTMIAVIFEIYAIILEIIDLKKED